MAIPDYQSLMRPVLQEAAQGEIRIGDVVNRLADKLALEGEERDELLPSGRQTVFSNRVHWAKTYLTKAGLLRQTRRAHVELTERGRTALAANSDRIDNTILSQYPEFQEFRARRSVDDDSVGVPPADQRTPDEVMRAAHAEIERSLRQDLLLRVTGAPPAFFESLIVKLLLAMGYGGSVQDGGRVLGGSGDNGVDGVIDQDALGLAGC